MYSKSNQYSMPKAVFNKVYEFLAGCVFHKDGENDVVIFRFATNGFAKSMLPQLEAASIPFILLEEKFV